MIKQKILTMLTRSVSLRSDADGWSGDDANVVNIEKPIGLSPGLYGFYCYDCPLKAMAAGWRLMAPPVEEKWDDGDIFYRWWFEKSS